MKNLMKMNPRDTVAVALRPIAAGEELTIDGLTVQAAQEIPQGHKIALTGFSSGDTITKYGAPIGHATVPNCRRRLDSYA